MTMQSTQAATATDGYPFAVEPHPAAPEAPAPVASEAPQKFTAADLDAMAARGDYGAIASAISNGLFSAPALPHRDAPPAAPVATVPSAAPARDTPAAVEMAPPRDDWAPSLEQCRADVVPLEQAAAICAGIDPVKLKAAHANRHLLHGPSDEQLDAMQSRVTDYRRALESDDAFAGCVMDPARVLKIERDALAEFKRRMPHKRANPEEHKRFRYLQPCSLKLAASMLLLSGREVFPGIVASASDVDTLPGSDYTEAETQLRAYGPIEPQEREALADRDVALSLQDATLFALGGSSLRRREVTERLTLAQMVPPLQPAAREALAILASAANDDEELIREAIAAAVQMAPEFLPGLLAEEAAITARARAENNYARSLTSPERRPPLYEYPIGERARRTLDAEALRRFFAHVAPLTGWAPPQLGAVPPTRSKFADVSPAVAMWMAMGGSNVQPGARR